MVQRSDAINLYLFILYGIFVVSAGAQTLDDIDPADYYSYYTPTTSREVDLERLYDYLSGILREEDGGGGNDYGDSRLVYAELPDQSEWVDEDPSSPSSPSSPSWGPITTPDEIGPWVSKRASRYSGRYTWKRRSGNGVGGGRTTSDSRGRYLCNPTREDIFQLLVALHEAREGNSRRIVNFCNRKRPASAIYTNIRFLGKRRK